MGVPNLAGIDRHDRADPKLGSAAVRSIEPGAITEAKVRHRLRDPLKYLNNGGPLPEAERRQPTEAGSRRHNSDFRVSEVSNHAADIHCNVAR